MLGVILGGAIGALSRHLANMVFQTAFQGTVLATYPLATLSVNLFGSCLLSFLFYSHYFHISPSLKTAIGTGFIGALTTFSTFELETFQLIDRGEWLIALLYLCGSVALGLAAIWLGRWLAFQVA
jgi:CrcB protein